MQDWLDSLNSFPGYLLLAIIAYCDTLIGIGFFILGEVAFLAAGAALAATGAIWPVIVVLFFAWAGDMTSYWIGSRYGTRLSLRYLGSYKRRRAWRRARLELEKRGAGFVVLSRLLGPVAWVTPFMAGTMGMQQQRFAAAAAMGVLLGVGQFILYGALGSKGLNYLLPLLDSQAFPFIVGALVSIAGGFYLWRTSETPFWIRCIKLALFAALVFIGIKLVYAGF